MFLDYSPLLVALTEVSNSVTPFTVVHEASLSMRFPRQKYWHGLPFPSPWILQSIGSQRVRHDWSNFISVAQLCLTLCDPMDCSTPGLPVHHQLPELTQTRVHWVSDAIQPSHPLSSSLPHPIFPSIRVFSDESVLHIRWSKYQSFSFSISPSTEYSGLISSRMDCLDLLALQGTLKSLFQNHSSKASILWHSPFFIVQLLHPYMTTGKTNTLTKQLAPLYW